MPHKAHMLEYFRHRLVMPFHLKLLIVLFLQHAHQYMTHWWSQFRLVARHPLSCRKSDGWSVICKFMNCNVIRWLVSDMQIHELQCDQMVGQWDANSWIAMRSVSSKLSTLIYLRAFITIPSLENLLNIARSSVSLTTGGRRSPAVACWASDHWVASSNPLRGKFRH